MVIGQLGASGGVPNGPSDWWFTEWTLSITWSPGWAMPAGGRRVAGLAACFVLVHPSAEICASPNVMVQVGPMSE